MKRRKGKEQCQKRMKHRRTKGGGKEKSEKDAQRLEEIMKLKSAKVGGDCPNSSVQAKRRINGQQQVQDRTNRGLKQDYERSVIEARILECRVPTRRKMSGKPD